MRVLAVAIATILFFSTLLLIAVYDTGTAEPGGIREDGHHPVIRLKYEGFDPLVHQPTVPGDLIGDEDDVALVQFDGPVRAEWRDGLEDHARVLTFLRDHTFIVHPETARSTDIIRTLPGVRWVGAYHPAYRIHEDLLIGSGARDVSVKLFWRSCEPAVVSAILMEMGVIVYERGEVNFVITARADPADVRMIAHLPWVEYIEPIGELVPAMDNIRNYTGADLLEEIPFNGSGVVGEVKDNGIDLDHVEFDGQLIGTDGTISEESHGTSTFGIVFAKGVNDRALGMAPGSGGVFCDWAVQRYQSILNLVNNWDGVFQSNSWYQGEPDSSYSVMSWEDDRAIMDLDVTMLYATGNGGTQQACSQDATAKNVIAVGGIRHGDNTNWDDDRHTGGQGNRGPADDGRIKPDLCGPYESIYTTRPGSYTAGFGGTSGATPVNAGGIALIYDMYEGNHFGDNPLGDRPHASTVKALAIANAHQYDLSQAERAAQGWGHIDVGSMYQLGRKHFIIDETAPLIMGGQEVYTVSATPDRPLKISLVWTDFPGSASASQNLINDLDLVVTSPSGTTYRGNVGLNESMWSPAGGEKDELNNVENVFIESPEAGTWEITISASEVVMDADLSTILIDQPFSLVAAGIVRETHDLLVLDHDLPEYFEPFVGENISAVIANFGEEAAFDVEVRFLIDGEIRDTAVLERMGPDDATTVTFGWEPQGPASHLLQLHVVPHPEETAVSDNWFNTTARAFYPLGRIVLDLAHSEYLPRTYVQELVNNDYQVFLTFDTITNATFENRTGLMTFEPTAGYSWEELSILEAFVRGGGGLLAVAGENDTIMSNLTAFADIGWSTDDGLMGATNEIEAHPITDGVNSLYFDTSELTIEVSGNAEEIVRDETFIFSNTLVAGATMDGGNVVAISDASVLSDENIYSEDNLWFGLNIAGWIDDQPPIVTIVEPDPLNAHEPDEEMNFTATVNDPDSSVFEYEWYSDIDGYLGNASTFKHPLQRGIHEVTITVGDGRSTGTHHITVIVNSTPSITLVGPMNGSYLEGTVELEWSIDDPEDDVTTAQVEVRSVDGEELENFDASEPDHVEIHEGNLTPGKVYSWRVKGTDPYGREVWSGSREFRYSNNAPTIDLLGPGDDHRLSAYGETFTWSGNDIDGDGLEYSLYFQSGSRELMYRGPMWNLTFEEPEQGRDFEWWVEVDDGFEVVSSERRWFLVNSLPSVAAFGPAEDERIGQGMYELFVTASDPDEDDVFIAVFWAGVDVGFATDTNDLRTNITEMGGGDRSWGITLDDGYDSVPFEWHNFSVNYDPTIEYLGPDDGGTVDNSFTLEWMGDDLDGDDLIYNLFLGKSSDPGQIRQTTGTEYGHFLYPGTYHWYVEVEDHFARVKGDVRSFVIPPGIAPEITVHEYGPTPSIAGETVSFTVTARDEDGTVEIIEWYSNIDGLISDALAFDIDGLSPGDHAITLNVTDNEGNVGTERFTITVLDRGSKPPVTFFAPPSPPYIAGRTIVFSFTGSYDLDGQIEEYRIDFGDGDESGWTSQPILTHRYSTPGNYLLTAQVRDDDGLMSRNVVSVAITVVSESEAEEEDDGESLISLLLSPEAILVIGIILVALVIGARRGSKGRRNAERYANVEYADFDPDDDYYR